jgi:branched-chain amino acid transport system permease protein
MEVSKLKVSRLGRKWIILSILGAVFFLSAPFWLGGYYLYLLQLLCIWIVVATGYNLLTGYTGLLNLAPAAFMGIGAYTTILLTLKLGVPIGLSAIGGVLATALVGFILGLPVMRLRMLYLGLLTIAFGEAVRISFLTWAEFFGGRFGLVVPTALDERIAYYIIFIVTIAAVIGVRNIVKSRTGRAFIAIRDSERASESLGINRVRYQILSFVISSFYAGVGGILWVLLHWSVLPEVVGFWMSLNFLLIVVLGGMGTIAGPVYGSILLMIIQQAFTRLAGSQDLVIGVVMFLAIAFFPTGIAGFISRRTASSTFLGSVVKAFKGKSIKN